MCVYKTVKELKISLVLYRIPHFYLHCVCFIVHCEIRSEVLIVGANFYLTVARVDFSVLDCILKTSVWVVHVSSFNQLNWNGKKSFQSSKVSTLKELRFSFLNQQIGDS